MAFAADVGEGRYRVHRHARIDLANASVQRGRREPSALVDPEAERTRRQRSNRRRVVQNRRFGVGALQDTPRDADDRDFGGLRRRGIERKPERAPQWWSVEKLLYEWLVDDYRAQTLPVAGDEVPPSCERNANRLEGARRGEDCGEPAPISRCAVRPDAQVRRRPHDSAEEPRRRQAGLRHARNLAHAAEETCVERLLLFCRHAQRIQIE